MKKPAKPSPNKLFNFRVEPEEIEEFRRAAEREGFGKNVSAWIRWHLRRIIRESAERRGKT